MLQTFRYSDSKGDTRGVTLGAYKRTEVENNGTTVYILDEDDRFVAAFLLLPGESVDVAEVVLRDPVAV